MWEKNALECNSFPASLMSVNLAYGPRSQTNSVRLGGPGECENCQLSLGVERPEGIDDGFHGSAGGEDIIDDEQGQGGGEGIGGVYRIEAVQFGGPLFFGEPFDRGGVEGFAEEAGMVKAVELVCQRCGQFVQGGGGVFPNEEFVVVQGTEDDAAGRDDVAVQHFQGGADPGGKVGPEASFEFQEAEGQRILPY